jgi:processive 1,2-diacylglycerol beta-glucosyltransferase
VAHGELEGYEGPTSFHVVGRTDDVPRLMAAADLLVGKPGGLTCSEALAAGLPLAVVKPYPLQEEANANVLLEHGAAVRIDPLSTFSHKLRLLLEDGDRRRDMRAAALRLARPGAARSIARLTLERLLARGGDARGPR